MLRTTILVASGFFIAALSAPPASATYMETCKALIDEWQACEAASGDCVEQSTKIEENCRCHSLQQGEWRLVNAAVEQSNVCGEVPTTIIIPPPPPPPPTEIHDRRGGGGADVPEVRRENDGGRGN